jgi:phosphatidylserine decarboxylase
VALGIVTLIVGFWFQPLIIVAGAILFLAAFVAFFFRDPERVPPAGEDLIISPADGKIVVIEPLGDREVLVSIFLSIFDVHVNRAPISGTVTAVDYREGRFMIATDKRASVENEQNVVTMENGMVRVVFKQIAGLIARRIVFWKRVGNELAGGERVGLIKFGSRVDVIMPDNVELQVRVGDHVRGGLSILGRVGEMQTVGGHGRRRTIAEGL